MDNGRNNGFNMLLVGVGGQGTILASRIIAGVALARGLQVKLSEVHGMAQRGGSVVTYLRAGEKIYSPLVEPGEADLLLAFEQLEAWRWLPYLSPRGKVVLNTQVIPPVQVILGLQEYPPGILERIQKNVPGAVLVEALGLARKAGNEKTVNVVMLGVLARQMDFGFQDWEKALEKYIPAKLLEVNREAFKAGYEIF